MMALELEVLEKVHAFYNDAFSQLVTYTLGLMGFVGIIIPFVSNWLQSRTLRAEKENLEEKIRLGIAEAREELEKANQEQAEKTALKLKVSLESTLASKTKEIDEKIYCLEAATFHIQGNAILARHHFALAACNFCDASINYLLGKDEGNAQRTLNLLVHDCFPEVNKEDYEKEYLGLEEKLKSLLNTLESNDENGRYRDTIVTIKGELRESQSRMPKAKKSSEPAI
jgi:hypothetical protein